MITKDSTKWWIGTFPSWLVTGLLVIIAYFARQSLSKINQIDEVIIPRLTIVETKIEIIKDDIKEIKSNVKKL